GVEHPVQVPQVVARGVLAVRRELDAQPEERAPVQPVHRPLDDRPGAQVDGVEPREEDGVDQGAGVEWHRGPHGSKLAPATSRRITASASTRSAGAWKLRTSRCRSTGPASAFTSSKSTWYLPARTARALAPSTRYCEARGLAP